MVCYFVLLMVKFKKIRRRKIHVDKCCTYIAGWHVYGLAV